MLLSVGHFAMKRILIVLACNCIFLAPAPAPQPDWYHFERLTVAYACTGSKDWASKVRNTNLRVLIKGTQLYFCSWSKAEELYSLERTFIRDTITFSQNLKQNSRECIMDNFELSLKRLFCTKPANNDIAFSVILSRMYEFFCMKRRDNIFQAVSCITIRYTRRMDIRNNVNTLLTKASLCPNEDTAILRKRQFDKVSAVMLWQDILKFRDNYPISHSGGGDRLKQLTYVVGRLSYCVLKNIYEVN